MPNIRCFQFFFLNQWLMNKWGLMRQFNKVFGLQSLSVTQNLHQPPWGLLTLSFSAEEYHLVLQRKFWLNLHPFQISCPCHFSEAALTKNSMTLSFPNRMKPLHLKSNPWLGIEPAPSTGKAWSPYYWTTKEFTSNSFRWKHFCRLKEWTSVVYELCVSRPLSFGKYNMRYSMRYNKAICLYICALRIFCFLERHLWIYFALWYVLSSISLGPLPA